jgi:hypothetical protein
MGKLFGYAAIDAINGSVIASRRELKILKKSMKKVDIREGCESIGYHIYEILYIKKNVGKIGNLLHANHPWK